MSNGTFFAVISNLFKLCKAMNSLITRLMLSAKKQEISNLSQLHLLIELFLKCAGLLHLLQRERGFSAYFGESDQRFRSYPITC